MFGRRIRGLGLLFNSNALMKAVKSPSNDDGNYRFGRQINVISD